MSTPSTPPHQTLGQRALQHLQAHPTDWLSAKQVAAGIGQLLESGGVHAALTRLVDSGHLRRDDTAGPRRYQANPNAPIQPAPARSSTVAGARARQALTGVIMRPGGHPYHTRELAGGRDVDVLHKLRSRAIPALLDGPPGSGKTALVEAAFGTQLHTVCGDADTTVGDFVGDYVVNGNGGYDFVFGPLVNAMRTGGVLFIDDCTLISPAILAVVYPVMDGRGTVHVKAQGNLPVAAEPGFYVIGGHNPHVHAAVLTPALSSRFGAQIHVPTDYDLAERLKVPVAIVNLARTLASSAAGGQDVWVPQMRELIAYRDLEKALGRAAALANLVSVCPEHDRDQLIAEIARLPELGEPNAAPLSLGGAKRGKATP